MNIQRRQISCHHRATFVEKPIKIVQTPLKMRNVKQYWLSQLSHRHINKTRSPTKSLTLLRPQYPSSLFRRKSCECYECGKFNEKLIRLSTSHPLSRIQQHLKERILKEAEQAGIIIRTKMKRQTQTIKGEKTKLFSPPSLSLGVFKYQLQDQSSAIRSGSITSIRLITTDLDSPGLRSQVDQLPETVVLGVDKIQQNPNSYKRRFESKDDIEVKYSFRENKDILRKQTIIKKSRYTQLQSYRNIRLSLYSQAQGSSKASSIEQTSAGNSQQMLQSQMFEESQISQTHRVRTMSLNKTVQKYVSGIKLPQIKPYDSQQSIQTKVKSSPFASKFRTQNTMQEIKKSAFSKGDEKITNVYLSKLTPRKIRQ